MNKGIAIAGDLRQPALTAQGGIYREWLKGYGELVTSIAAIPTSVPTDITRRLLVQEGQQVKVGQTIAEIGSTGTDRVKLHFEIRRQGKPVDPLQFLPRR